MTAAGWRTVVWGVLNIGCAELLPLGGLWWFSGKQAVLAYVGHSTLYVVAVAIYCAVLADAITSLNEVVCREEQKSRQISPGGDSEEYKRKALRRAIAGMWTILGAGLMLALTACEGLYNDYLSAPDKPQLTSWTVFKQAGIVSVALVACLAYKYREWCETHD